MERTRNRLSMRHAVAALALLGSAMLSVASPDLVDGEVRKVDKPAGKITLKHGEIRSIEMPAMTMVYQLREPALLDKVKPGDKVRFAVEKSGSVYLITALEVVRPGATP